MRDARIASTYKRHHVWISVSVFIALFVLDRCTKLIALFVFLPSLTFNGRAFFFFDDSLFSAALLTMLVALLGAWFLHELRTRTSMLGMVASACIVAGALSNVLDRIRYGAIIDWIPLYGISVFNLADVFIVIGCILVIVSIFVRKKV